MVLNNLFVLVWLVFISSCGVLELEEKEVEEQADSKVKSDTVYVVKVETINTFKSSFNTSQISLSSQSSEVELMISSSELSSSSEIQILELSSADLDTSKNCGDEFTVESIERIDVEFPRNEADTLVYDFQIKYFSEKGDVGDVFLDYPTVQSLITFAGDTLYVDSDVYFGQGHNSVESYKVRFSNVEPVPMSEVKSIIFSYANCEINIEGVWKGE